MRRERFLLAVYWSCLSARFRSRLAGSDALEAPGGNRGIVAVLIPGLAPGVSFRVIHESCVGACCLSAHGLQGRAGVTGWVWACLVGSSFRNALHGKPPVETGGSVDQWSRWSA